MCPLALLAEEEVELELELPVVKLSPQIRSGAAGIQAYTDLACEELAGVNAESAAQQRALAARKQQCLEQYRQFIPNTGLR
ncbi:hypothetical protein DOK_10532 [gamma proteobacterium BDW918]|uniref:Uncharacterized protein n=1 Tax=Zhongshania aliphaticivorans TaxID=1470434 RepID=A0A127M5G2_9GAMM|nr:hypothetical protein AZF00_09270 [Zhongshania aliphaticivorans]EIF43049.1 hypothetical protein DOK_10532 [gamma proteobacterium BDW918]